MEREKYNKDKYMGDYIYPKVYSFGIKKRNTSLGRHVWPFNNNAKPMQISLAKRTPFPFSIFRSKNKAKHQSIFKGNTTTFFLSGESELLLHDMKKLRSDCIEMLKGYSAPLPQIVSRASSESNGGRKYEYGKISPVNINQVLNLRQVSRARAKRSYCFRQSNDITSIVANSYCPNFFMKKPITNKTLSSQGKKRFKIKSLNSINSKENLKETHQSITKVPSNIKNFNSVFNITFGESNNLIINH